MKLSLRDFLSVETKSKIKAGDGQAKGDYKFFTSSPIQSKFINLWLYDAEALVFGTGGNASVHYVNDKFSTSTDCLVMTNKMPNDVNLKCIYYYLAGNIHLLAAGFKGCGLQHISKEFILNIKIDLPERDVQDEIVAVFDLLTTVRIGKEKQLQKLDNLVKSQFIEMFGDPVINEKGWAVVKLSEVAEMKIGPFGSLLHKEDYISGGHALVNPSHIEDGKIKADSSLSISDEKYNELSAYHLKRKDIVLGRRGEMGRCAVVKDDGLLCGTGSMIIRPTGQMLPYFLQSVLSSPSMKLLIEERAVGVTMANLNVPIVSNLPIPMYPIEKQRAYIRILEQTDKSKVLCSFALEYQNRMACLIVKMPRICYN